MVVSKCMEKGRGLTGLSPHGGWRWSCAGRGWGHQEPAPSTLEAQVSVVSRCVELGDSGGDWGSLRGRKDFSDREGCSPSQDHVMNNMGLC